MKVALFFDGKNFYSGWRDHRKQTFERIDFIKLADYLVKYVKGTSLCAAHYYTGIEPPPASEESKKLDGFLASLGNLPGFRVHTFPRRQVRVSCNNCNQRLVYSQEKEVDTQLVADVVRYAAVNAFDIAIILSGDSDLRPAIDAITQMGKIAYVASFGNRGLSNQLREAAFAYIDLIQGAETFCTTDEVPTEDSDSIEESAPLLLDELRAAEQNFAGGYVGLSYFTNKWRANGTLTPVPQIRKAIIDLLKEQGLIEIYQADDSSIAIRTRT